MDKDTIQSALAAIPTGDFTETSKALLAALGYQSERTLELSGTVDDFIDDFPALNPNTTTEQAFCNAAASVQLLCDALPLINQWETSYEGSPPARHTNSVLSLIATPTVWILVMKAFPIPPITDTNLHLVNQIEKLVDEIIATKTATSEADVVSLENAIDRVVYSLYGLTVEEIAIVEGSQ